MKNLVIVESPAKAKTIEKYLGKEYSVKSSFGHIRDLPKKGLNIDVEHNFRPNYQVSSDNTKLVNQLKKDAATAKTVLLASDEDREGEAIAWHLCQTLSLNEAKAKRIVFHEITKDAILRAVANPRTIDMNLVDAQQARRILDRLVGYELSPVLWKKVRPGLSAGRVQSVAVRLIVEREREIKNFAATSSYKIQAQLLAGKEELTADLPENISDQTKARTFLGDCTKADFRAASIMTKPGKRNPSPPFTTSTLQQETGRRLGFSVRQTMTLAQRLYERGYITYMRTDSITLSTLALKKAEDYICQNFGQDYHERRQYKTKDNSAQEAHEAIRPTSFTRLNAGQDNQEKRLYQLIWQRALASQMAAAIVDRTEITISISTRPEYLLAKGEVLRFEGFYKVYGKNRPDIILPTIKEGQELKLQAMTARQVFSKPPARYSEASLVRRLEELGIGRPSTYAPTISIIQSREYIEKRDIATQDREIQQMTLAKNKISEEVISESFGGDKNKLLPTPLAEVTTDFLTKHFASIVDYDFTAHAESRLDTIAAGQEKWENIIKDFYEHFHPLVTKSEKISRQESTQTRQLGVDPATKKPVFARYGRFGPMIQRGETESETKPDFAPMPPDTTLEDVTLEQALEMLRLPRLVGKTKDGQEIKANIGRFGPYIQVDKIFVSIKDEDPRTITEKQARELFAAKQKMLAKRDIKTFSGGIKILNGPYGPYVTDGKKNAKIPEGKTPAKLTEEECKVLLDATSEKKRYARRKKS